MSHDRRRLSVATLTLLLAAASFSWPTRAADPSAAALPSDPPASPQASASSSPQPQVPPTEEPSSAATDGGLLVTDGGWRSLQLSWRYGSVNPEPSGWQSPAFDDSSWNAVEVIADPHPAWFDIPDGAWIIDGSIRPNERLDAATWLARRVFQAGVPASAVTLSWNSDARIEGIWLNGQPLVGPADGGFGRTTP